MTDGVTPPFQPVLPAGNRRVSLGKPFVVFNVLYPLIIFTAQSPPTRSDHSKPLLEPPPEITAELAGSLRRYLKNEGESQAQKHTQAHAERQVCSPLHEPRTAPSQDPNASWVPSQTVQGPPSLSADGSSPRQHKRPSPPPSGDPKRRKRKSRGRTKTGCLTCRARKKKCDERKLICAGCELRGISCEWHEPNHLNTFERAPATATDSMSQPSWLLPKSWRGSNSDFGRVMQSDHQSDHHQPQTSFPVNHPLARSRQNIRANWSSISPAAPTGNMPILLPANPPALPAFAHCEPLSLPSIQELLKTLPNGQQAQKTEKEKMLLGEPFSNHDQALMQDRQQCKRALEEYNSGAGSSPHLSPKERHHLFCSIVEPTARKWYSHSHEPYTGPRGHIGQGTVVESPFTCDYGYNVFLGDDVVIQSGCHMQDPCEISIGDRTIVGPNVKFYGMTATRNGGQGPVRGGAIRVEADCLIGGDVVILPFRKIGKGAVVGASSVVTKDVKDYTVVAGSPARVLRRIESGPHVDRHHPEIEEQNDAMLQEMWE
ncbi:hypothetical protein D0867_02834 [Hortaea werneckii]|uniref:Zn(2)-C6 fungal-type domain-containing protein n=1 Tax=Hortaea werneckii TaxID=91943 RepID=A0A3M7A3W2_HORWE|nr:hypothetical protein D0867_02834 [Hortaea werneckii]RMY37980.1 hypothetical protein D0866_02909 [Hortaea werneckii]